MQMIADGKINKNQDLKIIFNDNSVESFKFDGDDILDGTYRNIFDIYGTKVILKQDFEILEDTTEEIEELNYYTVISTSYGIFQEHVDEEFKKHAQKINELVKAVNRLNKPIDTYKETHCMTD